MAVERQAPDALLSSANYSSLAVADIEDDPDSPDGLWGTWDGNGSTDCRVSFPTPSGAPITGAGLQEFKAWIRKTSSGGNAAPWSLELWESGAQVSVLATGTATSLTGEMASGTWDSTSLGTADGSAVELLLLQTNGGGGGPSNRRGVEVGAVEWNADIASIGDIVATADGTSTVTAAIDAIGGISGTAGGSATTTGTVEAAGAIGGTSGGLATASAIVGGIGAIGGQAADRPPPLPSSAGCSAATSLRARQGHRLSTVSWAASLASSAQARASPPLRASSRATARSSARPLARRPFRPSLPAWSTSSQARREPRPRQLSSAATLASSARQ